MYLDTYLDIWEFDDLTSDFVKEFLFSILIKVGSAVW